MSSTQTLQPAREELLPFQGVHGIDGLCHVRTYERPGRLPVVIAGELDDNPGTKIRKAIPAVARAIQRELFGDGREFVLVEYRPVCGAHPGSFELVHLVCGAEGALLPAGQGDGRVVTGDLGHRALPRAPRRRVADIAELTGCAVATWPRGRYVARAVAGLRGEYLRREVAAQGRTSVQRMMAMLAQR
jgi:hypothetical protein